MRVVLQGGKALALLFWGAVLVNLSEPFAQPFAGLLQLAGALLVGFHLLQLVLFGACLRGAPRLWLARLQVLLFGAFQLFDAYEAQPAVMPVEASALEGVQHA